MADLTPVVAEALQKQADNKTNDLTAADASKVTPQVAKEVNKEVNAIITNITNQEPLWQSRMFIGALVTALLQLASLAGVITDNISPESTTNLVMQGISIVSAIYAAYGRAVVNKPLGQ